MEDAELDHAQCLILDIHLPGQSGIDLAKEILSLGHAIPTIFLTADDSAETRARARSTGCAAFLMKPFSGALLLEALRSTSK